MNQDLNQNIVVVIDDDSDFNTLVEWKLNNIGLSSFWIKDITALRENVDALNPSIILLDWQFGEIDGTELIQELKEKFTNTSIIFTTAHATPEIAARSIQLGAFDFLTKPLDESRFQLTMTRAAEQTKLLCRLDDAGNTQMEDDFFGIIAQSPQMQAVFSTIKNVAQTDAAVMISGESGVGKELIASAIHSSSPRANQHFAAINMATVPENLTESLLFGHEKGSFTGADKKQTGAIQQANMGTMFLDEITEMPIQLQSKLLRFLQEGAYRPVGSNNDFKVDVRILSATNRNPLEAIKDEKLREDLYYRLNVIPIEVPPLRERDGDIALLAVHFLNNYAQKYEKAFVELSPGALDLLEQYPWPGNVRELSHVIQRIVILNDTTVVNPKHIPQAIKEYVKDKPSLLTECATRVGDTDISVTESEEELFSDGVVPLAELERLAIEKSLNVHEGAVLEAAKALGISRATIYRKISLYGINQKFLPNEIEE